MGVQDEQRTGSGRPLHLFGGIGVLLSLAGLAICAYLIGGRLLQLWWLSDRPLLLIGVFLVNRAATEISGL